MTVSMTTKQMLAWLAEWMLLPWIELKNLGREKKMWVGRGFSEFSLGFINSQGVS